MVISLLRKVLRHADTPATSTEIRLAIAEVDARISSKSAQGEALSARRLDAMLDDEAAAAKIRRQCSDIADEVTDLAAARDQLLARLEDAQADEAEAERRRRYEAARGRRDATLKSLRQRLPKHFREHLALLRMIEETRSEVDEANANLPMGAPLIDEAEGLLRDAPYASDELVHEKREVVWYRTDVAPNQRIDPSQVRDFKDLGGGRGQFVERTNRVGGESFRTATDQPVPCVGFIEIARTVRPAILGQFGDRLRNVAMPGVRWHEPGYSPLKYPNPSPDSVLTAIAEAEAAASEPATPERSVRIISSREDLP